MKLQKISSSLNQIGQAISERLKLKSCNDWRYQAAEYGLRSAKGDPILSIELAEDKYRTLLGRKLNISELHELNKQVRKLLEEMKDRSLLIKIERRRNANSK